MLNAKHLAILILALSLVVAGCAAPTAAPTPKPTKVTMLLDWTPNTNHTGLYVAKAKGWYAEQGLDVDIIQPGEGGTPVQLIAADKGDFGISFQEEVTHARATDIPVISIGAIIQHNTSGFASVKDKNITQPKGFEGKKYGAFGLPIEQQVLDVLMKCDGGDVNKVTFVDIGASDPLMAIQREMDFVWIYYGWEGIEAELRGIPLNVVMLSDWTRCLPDYYTPVIVTSEKTIAQRPDLIKRFMAATAKGYQFAIDNPSEAADILIKAVPEMKAELVRKSQAWLSPRYKADAPRWGEQKLEVWRAYGDWMADRGLISKKIDASKAFTNAFLP